MLFITTIGEFNLFESSYLRLLTHFNPMLRSIQKPVICFFSVKKMTGFYMKRNIELKWVKTVLTVGKIPFQRQQQRH